MRLRYATFDDLARHPDAIYIPPSRPAEPTIVAEGLQIADSPDDLVILHDALAPDGVGFVWRDLWAADTIHSLPGNWRTVRWLPGQYDTDTETIEIDDAKLAPTHVIDEPVLPVDAMSGWRNFGHFVHDTVPYGRLFDRVRRLLPGLRVHAAGFKFPNQFRLFNAVFEQPWEARVDIRRSRLRQLVLARRQTMISSTGNPLSWSLPFAGLRHARERALRAWGAPGGSGGAPRIYLHRFQDVEERRQVGLLYGRNFVNMGELLDGMMAAGFVVLEPGSSRIEDIAHLLSGAECVASLHGAGLANLLFCRPGTRVFELRSHSGNWRSLEATSLALGHDFRGISQPRPADPEQPSLDVPSIMRTIVG